MAVIQLPDFNFAAFYYTEVLEALLEYQRKNVPEISNESPFELSIQMQRSFALIAHLNNVLTDLVANETQLPPARLRASVVRLLALIGFTPNANIPAVADVRMRLTSGFTASTLIVPDNALFGTRRQADTNPIEFEADESVTVNPTNELDAGWLYRADTGVWTDKTTEVNTDSSTLVFDAIVERHLYLAHDSAMTDTVEITGISTALDLGDDRAATPHSFHLQYFDGNLQDTQPDAVDTAFSATGIRFDINGLVGDLPKIGTYAHVFVNASGATQRRPVLWESGTGTNYIVTDGFLGQSSVSTTPTDYTVGSYWHDIAIDSDETEAAPQISGEVFDVGDTFTATFGPHTLARYPLEPDTVVTWSYLSGSVAKTASYDLSDGSLGGDAATGTTVNASTGVATLVCTSNPDVGNITVAYSRKAQRLQNDGAISFKVPKTIDDDWTSSELPVDLRGTTGPTVDAYWLRFIVCAVGAGAVQSLTFDRAKWDQGGLYIAVGVTQGRTITNEVAGSGDGTANQSFILDETPVLEGSVVVSVDGTEWTQVDSFASSTEVSEHYLVEIDGDGIATITFGDGISGAVAPDGTNNITAEYRVGGAENGNVGIGQITVNRSGISRVRNITNPRAAYGWTQQEGSDEQSLEKLKRDGVASLRTLGRAVSPADVEYLTSRFEDAAGSKPFSRSRAIENGFGLKTIKNVVVGVGGTTTSSAARQALDLYFNGDLDEGGTTGGVVLSNQQVTSIDFTPHTVDIAVVVTGGNEAAIKAALLEAIQPEALLSDGSNWRWRFGQKVTRAAINGIIWGADKNITDIDLQAPATDEVLTDVELPQLGTLTLTVQ